MWHCRMAATPARRSAPTSSSRRPRTRFPADRRASSKFPATVARCGSVRIQQLMVSCSYTLRENGCKFNTRTLFCTVIIYECSVLLLKHHVIRLSENVSPFQNTFWFIDGRFYYLSLLIS